MTYLYSLLQGKPLRFRGHDPAGSWSIFLLLSLGLGLSISGLLVFGMKDGHGPLYFWFNPPLGELWANLHYNLAVMMLVMVALHISAVIFVSRLRRENLARAMLNGYKSSYFGGERVIFVSEHAEVAVGLLITVLATLAFFCAPYLAADARGEKYLPFRGPKLPNNHVWQQECGACHLAYHPVLLPSRSWTALFETQHDHFGSDLKLDAKLISELKAFHIQHAAENLYTEAGYAIWHSLDAQQTPLRITETPYWRDRHAMIQASIWSSQTVRSRTNCAACHLDAQEGTFEDAAMQIPKI